MEQLGDGGARKITLTDTNSVTTEIFPADKFGGGADKITLTDTNSAADILSD